MSFGSVLGGISSYFGSRNANRMAQGTAREQMAFQREENQTAMAFSEGQTAKQMAFQERMAGSEFQRGMNDMKAAGLNPILAYSKGGASSPGGASASGVTSGGARADQRNQMEGVVNAAKALAELDILKSQNKNIQADTENKEQTNVKGGVDEFFKDKIRSFLDSSAKKISDHQRKSAVRQQKNGGTDYERKNKLDLNFKIGTPNKKKEYNGYRNPFIKMFEE